MTNRTQQLNELIVKGAQQLLARATDTYEVASETVEKRILAAVTKYVLRDDEHAPSNVISEFIETLQADDLCLIVACERGSERAWSDLVERFSTTIRSAARSATSNEDSADDLAQSIWAELHGLRMTANGAPAGKLAYYSGRGSLAGWLRAVVAQLAVDQHRKQSRFVQTEEEKDFDSLTEQDGHARWRATTTVVNPELETSRKAAGEHLQQALNHSLGRLPAEDRLLIKLYYFDGLRLREAGGVLGVHEATASRRLTRIHKELRDRVERFLIDERKWTREEAEKAFADLAVHLDADIEPMLASDRILANESNEVVG